MKPTPQRSKLAGFPLKKSIIAMSGAILASTGIMSAHAQVELEEIVVTGTLIRGIEPTGQQVIGIDTQQIIDSGARTANELLGTLPQVDNLFQSRPAIDPRANGKITIFRPNLRNLPGNTTGSGSATLVLVDGHRLAPLGINQSAVDPDILPPAIIDRVEVVTDGGSSLYGADAVGGVINFVTKKDFDGVQIDAGYDTADDYGSYNTNITAGTSWEGGSGYVSISYAERDQLTNGDRSWARSGVFSETGFSGNSNGCLVPVVASESYVYAFGMWNLLGSTASGEKCDRSQLESLLPEEDRGSVFFGVNQQINEKIEFTLKGYYSEKNTTLAAYPRYTDSVQLSSLPANPANFQFADVAVAGFSYGAWSGYQHADNEVTHETFGLTPELAIDITDNWQLRTSLYYGTSESLEINPGVQNEKELAYVSSGAINPLDLDSSDADAIRDVLNWSFDGQAEQDLLIARALFDGPVMDLPGGEVFAAIGLEYTDQESKQRKDNVVTGGIGSLQYGVASRDLTSLFAELRIPVIGEDNNFPGVEALTLSASVRSDDYSDFGETTNPSIGLSYNPVEWITFTANWNESFNAPTPVDKLNAQFSTLAYFPFAASFITKPDDIDVDTTARRDAVLIQGADNSLKPQTAETFSFGIELLPPSVEGLRLSATYYDIEFTDVLGSFNPVDPLAPLLFRDAFIWGPSDEELAQYAGLTINGEDSLVGRMASDVGVIIDFRTTNTDVARLKGYDFAISYVHDTELGTLDYGISGTGQLTNEQKPKGGGEWTDLLDSGSSELSYVASVGLTRDNFRARAFYKFREGYKVINAYNQSSVDDIETVDLFLGYDFNGTSGLTEGLSLRLKVENVFDQDPPEYRVNDNPAYIGFTLGRLFSLGITKTFE